MKRFTINLLLILFTANVLSETILLKGGLVHQGNGEVAITTDILIADNRIVDVGKNLIIDGNTRVIEVNGLHVTPGLISPMSNLGIVEINSLDVTRDDESNILNAGFSIFNAFNPNSTGIPWNRSNGVTSAISTPSPSSFPIFGLGSYFVLDGSLQVKGTKDIAMYGRLGPSDGSRAETLAILESLLEAGSMLKNSTVDEILEMTLADKLELQPEDIIALGKVVNDYMPFVLETNRAVDILQALSIKEKYSLNLVLASVEEAPMVLDQLKNSNTPVIIDPMDNIPNSFDELGSNLNLGKILDEAGICLLYTSDAADE